jgi:hypothetical protein
MKRMIHVGVGIAVALFFVSGPVAASETEEMTEQVDWDDAAYYAELMDTFVNDDAVVMDTYYDEGQNVLWSQPASELVEAAADVFPQGAEYAMTLDFFEWIAPTLLWLCHEDEGECIDGHKWSGGDFNLFDTSATVAYYEALDPDCSYTGIERIRAKGSSNFVDYCDAYYWGYYRNDADTGWGSTDVRSCSGIGSPPSYRYTLDDSSHVDGYSYTPTGATRVARFRFAVPGAAYHYSEIWLASCLE